MLCMENIHQVLPSPPMSVPLSPPSAVNPKASDSVAALCDLSLTQQEILLRQELLGSAIYTIGLTVDIEGPLDPVRLERAVQEVVAAEPMLRAHVHHTAHGPQWQLTDHPTWTFHYSDHFGQLPNPGDAESHALQDIETLKTSGIDPQGPLLWRMRLFRIAPQRHLWLMCFNHVLVDGYGVMLAGQRIWRRYSTWADSANTPIEQGPAYARFVTREQTYLRSSRYAQDQTYWEDRLTQVGMRRSHEEPELRSMPQPAHHRWRAAAPAWQRFLQLAAAQGLSTAQSAQFFLASFTALVTGQRDVLLGMPVHNRKDALDKQTIGLFTNTLPVRLTIPPGCTLPQLMRALLEDIRHSLRHQQYPLGHIRALRPPGQGTSFIPFDLMVSFEAFEPDLPLGDARMRFAPFRGYPGFAPVAAYIRQYGDSEALSIDFTLDPRAHPALRHTASLSARLDTYLAELIEHPGHRLEDLHLLNASEQEAWSSTPALAAPGLSPQHQADTPKPQRQSPETLTEQLLWTIWSEVLHTEAFGVTDHFFDLGGHSLTLTQVRTRIHSQFAIELPLGALFTHLSIAELAAYLDQQIKASPAQNTVEPPSRTAQPEHTLPLQTNVQADDDVPSSAFVAKTNGPLPDQGRCFPASLSQRRMWVIQHFHPNSVAYNITTPLRLRGPLDLHLFKRTLDLLVERHEGLRTQFALAHQEPVQIILTELSANLEFVDLRALAEPERELAAKQAAVAIVARPFDLSKAPLFRVALLQLHEREWVLLWVLHHTIADNWAMSVLTRDALQIYAELLQDPTNEATIRLPALTVHYTDYAANQRSPAATASRETDLAYWQHRLQGLTDLSLPTDFPRPSEPSFKGGALHAPLSEQLIQAMRSVGVQYGVTPFMVLLASFNVLLARLSGRTDIAVGTPIANRHHAATEQLVGTLVNTLVMRNTIEPDAPFELLLQRVRDTALHAYAHQDAPFDELVERLDAQRGDTPQGLVRVLFNVLNAPLGKLADVPFTYEVFDFERIAAQFDLSIHVDTEFSRQIQLEYATDLFNADTAQRLLDSYVFLTEQLLAQPALPISSHALVTPAQRALLDRWNATSQPLAAPLTLPAALKLDAPDRRDRAALTDAQGHTLHYPELQQRALGIAHHLRRMGVGRGDRVGLCLHRSADMVAAMLGVVQAGAAYVPLDPSFPPERLRYMATDAQLRCLLTQADLMSLMAEVQVPQFALDRAPLAQLRSDVALPPDPDRDARPDDPAYMIYTSGSTGQPKGVQIPHRAVVNFLRSMAREPGLRPDDALLAVTTLSFDIAVLELLLPLAVGARVVLADHAQSRDPFALRDLLRDSGATVLQATPSTWRMLLDAGWRGHRGLRAFIGGEALPADLAPRLLQACDEVWNLYGPTETTVWSTCWRVQPQQPIVIGRPIDNTQVWILDPQGQLCPIGTPGEIHIGGAGVTLGYFQRPELTAERFIADPFSPDPQARLYKTGDLGRWRHDGQLEHLGRLDHQVKIRGFRIELGEIEAVLREQADLASCVLTTYAPTPDDVRLVAYIVPPLGTAAPLAAELRQTLRQRLPDYMVPQHIVPLDALPLLPNGKLDRAALPAPRADAPVRQASSPGSAQPATPEEHQIAAIWRELLGVDQILLTDNFFDLGGHSLLAMRAVIAIEQHLGWRIAPRRLIFESLGQIARPAPGRSSAA